MKVIMVRGLMMGAAPFGGNLGHGVLSILNGVFGGEGVTVVNTQMPRRVVPLKALSP